MTVGRAITRIGLALGLFALLWVSCISISFSAICPKCLQYAHGRQMRVLGIPCYYQLRPSQSHRGLGSPDAFTDRVPPVDPKLYEKILGKRCRHDYRKLGFCRYTFWGVACGGGGASRWDPQLQAIEQIYRAFGRIDDKFLAGQSFRIANDLSKAMRSSEHKWRELEAFGQGLGVISSRDEWGDLITRAQSGKLLEEDFRKDLPTLRSALVHTNGHVRLNALERLADLNDPEAWQDVGSSLSNKELAPHAAQRILWACYPPLLGKALRYYAEPGANVEKTVWPFPATLWPWHPNLSDEQIQGLFREKDRWIDAYCLPHIWIKGRIDLIDAVLAILNERPSPAAKLAVEQLIAGRCPFYLPPFDINAPVDQKPPYGIIGKAATLSFSAFLTNYNSPCLNETKDRMCKMQREILRLAQQPSPACWQPMKMIVDQWGYSLGAESHMAASVELLLQCDRERTRRWIAQELEALHPDKPRFTSILTAVAVVAEPEFLPALESLRSEHPSLNWHLKSYLDYALHRCRRVHLWKLVQLSTAEWTLLK